MTVALHGSTLPDTERQRRQKAVNTARASVRLEGFVLDEFVEGLYAQYVCGELELAEVMAQVQQYARRSA
jgi:hypothetical protein